MFKTTFSTLFSFLCIINVQAQDVSIIFEVNMSYQIEEENFFQDAEFVDIAGSFNGWGETLIKLSDADNDSIYSVEIDGFAPDEEIEFKFRINGEWNDREEFPGAGNNRQYTVEPENNIISVWYNDQQFQTGPPEADFYASSRAIFSGGLVQFQNHSGGNVSSWKWSFEGGSPEHSEEEQPAVRYNEAGTFDVQLIASHDTLSDTLLIQDYITVTERAIGDQQPEWWNERVFYEIFVRSFYDSDGDGIGDFNGLTEKLDYLNDGDPETQTDLGIGGIWLMPINPSPSYHGYDVTDYRAINPDYGTMEDFKNFLEEAHKRDIKVIIDFVMNHSSTEHPWFQKSAAGDTGYRDFYRWSDSDPGYNGPWGQQVWHQRNGEYYYGLFWGGMPDLNYENPAVKDSMFAISDFWINDIGIDGFRQDAVLYIDEDGNELKNTPETLQFWSDFNINLKAANPDAFAVGEAWEATDIALQYMTNNRLDYVFEFDLALSILRSANNEEAAPVLSQMQNVYDAYPFLQYGTFLTNHDQNRVMNEVQQDVDKAKTAASMYLTLPGIPYIYYGEEIGMLGQKPDEDIRLPMQWSDNTYAGFSTTQPWRSPNGNYGAFNVEEMKDEEESIFNQYRRLIQARNNHPDLSVGEYEAGLSTSEGLFVFLREDTRYNGSPTMVAINLTADSIKNASASFSKNFFPYGPSNAGYNQASVIIGNYNPEIQFEFARNESEQQVHQITLAPYETKVITVDALLTSGEEENNPQGFKLNQNYPNPFNPSTNISFNLPSPQYTKLKVYDLMGRLVSVLLNQRMASGQHAVNFDASALSSGIYFYEIEAGSYRSIQKMTLIK